jgi:hypothetical protein
MADLAHAAENDTDLHGDPDAAHWAERFAARFLAVRLGPDGRPLLGEEPVEVEGLMLAWFAGAIETGKMCARARILAELGADHFVVFAGDRWTMEHSAQCRLSGAMSECEFHTAMARVEAGPMSGRWRMTGVNDDGLPVLERPGC